MAVVEFINAKNYKNQNLKRVLAYIKRDDKTSEHLIHTKDCMRESDYDEMQAVKEAWNKTGGRKYIHFTQSFSPDEPIAPEEAFEIGRKLLEHKQFMDFQVVMAVHTDREHIHTHYIINSVSFVDGRKYQQSDKDLQSIKDFSDKLCRDAGFSVIEHDGESKHSSRGEYRAASKSGSWKYKLMNTIDSALDIADTKQDFIRLLKEQGYGVNWSDTRKYITYTTPDGLKCRDNRLGSEQYSKAAMDTLFENPMLLKARKAAKDEVDIQFKTFFEILLGEEKPQTLIEQLKSLNRPDGGAEFSSLLITEVVNDIEALLSNLPPKGKYYFSKLDREAQEVVVRIAEKILYGDPKISNAVDGYIQSAVDITRQYIKSEHAVEQVKIEAYDRILRKVEERILLTAWQMRQIENEKLQEDYKREMTFELCVDILYMLGSENNECHQRSHDYHSELSRQAKIELAHEMESKGLDWEH